MLMLAPLFFTVALVYSMVGFGGGSSYIALLVIFDTPYELIPIVALICNITVVAVGSMNFIRSHHVCWPLVWPFVVTSVPASYVGGQIPAEKTTFLLVLGVVLLIAGCRMIWCADAQHTAAAALRPLVIRIWGPVIGVLLGLVSGFVGIGGGIFLAPIMHAFGWGKPKQIAATASLFILANSVAGLGGQLQKHGVAPELPAFALLPVAVLVGGYLGSGIGSRRLNQRHIVKITGVVVLAAAVRILYTLMVESTRT